MKYLKFYLSIILILSLSTTYGQYREFLDNPTGFLVQIDYGVEVSTGVFAERFGSGFSVGLSPVYITKKRWLFGVESKYFFGGEVQEDVVSNLRTSSGYVIAQDKSVSDVALNQRAFFLGGSIGKIIPLTEDGRSGIRFNVNAGFFQHRIRIEDGGSLPQLAGAYRAGYDRLTYGLGLTEFVGYKHFSRNRLVNFYAGFEFTHGFTQNRRTVNYDTGIADTAKRQDFLWSFQVGWILPIYDAKSTETYY
jgi:hypothetical protein